MFCTGCGSAVSDSAKFCAGCGAPLSLSLGQSENHQQGLDGDEELRLFVGKKSDYYINKWNKAKNNQSWNWAAFFTGLFWVGYRKMYKVIFITFGIFLLLDIITILVNSPVLDNLNNYGVSVGMAVVFGTSGNYFYSLLAKRRIQKIKDAYPNNPEVQAREIQKQGGSSWKGVFISLAVFVLYIVLNIGLYTLQ
jgi:hypothetical protein